jgi:FkbM family methyltransferase
MIRLRDKMTAWSRVRYLLWRAGIPRDEVFVRLRSGERILLQKSERFLLGTAYEVFISKIYEPPHETAVAKIRRIVDVGANVGLTLAYWAIRYPDAEIEAFEPHPGHVAALRRVIAANHIDGRVKLHPHAAAPRGYRCHLTDAGTASMTIPDDPSPTSLNGRPIPITAIDFFETIGPDKIDLLKLDCEGAEVELLMDECFARLNADRLVMEWHETAAHPNAERELIRRLCGLGWQVEKMSETDVRGVAGLEGMSRIGLLWAFRSKPREVKVTEGDASALPAPSAR